MLVPCIVCFPREWGLSLVSGGLSGPHQRSALQLVVTAYAVHHIFVHLFRLTYSTVVGYLALSSWTQSTSAFTVGGGSLALRSCTQSSSAFAVGGWLFGVSVVDTVFSSFHSGWSLLALCSWTQSSTASAVGGWLFGGSVVDTVFFSFYSGWWLFGASLVHTVFFSFHGLWLALWRSRRGHGLLQSSSAFTVGGGSLALCSWTRSSTAFTVGGGSLAACSRTQSSTSFSSQDVSWNRSAFLKKSCFLKTSCSWKVAFGVAPGMTAWALAVDSPWHGVHMCTPQGCPTLDLASPQALPRSPHLLGCWGLRTLTAVVLHMVVDVVGSAVACRMVLGLPGACSSSVTLKTLACLLHSGLFGVRVQFSTLGWMRSDPHLKSLAMAIRFATRNNWTCLEGQQLNT